MALWEIVSGAVREFFRPLRDPRFWIGGVMAAVLGATWADYYSPMAKRCQEVGGHYSVFNGGTWPLQSGCKK